MDLTQFREMYFADVTERLVRMNQLILALESDPVNCEMIDTLFRETHSLKGMAAAMHYDQTEKLSHHLESLLDPCRKSGEIPKQLIDKLLDGVDLLGQLLDDIGSERPERFIDLTSLPQPSEKEQETVSSRWANSTAPKSSLALAPAATPMSGLLPGQPELQQRATPPPETSDIDRTVRIRAELLDQFMNLTGELITNRFMLQSARENDRWSDLDSALEALGKLVDKLHHHVLQARMTPLEKITSRFPRLVHDLGRKTGKEIKLVISGEELELDRSILELLTDPLIHLIRNAVDHGIDASGQITIRAWRERNTAFLEVADNGRGIEPETLRSTAIKRGLMTSAAVAALEEKELLQLICSPGFSTSATIGEISGRGVGMNIVKKTVDSLGGILEIRSVPGAGTSFLLKLPLTIFIIRILLIRCGGRTVGLPVTRILHVQEFAGEEDNVSYLANGITHPTTIHHFVSLATLLNLDGAEDHHSVKWVALTEVNGKTVGLVFDELLGQREAYVKPLSPPLDRFDVLSGATILGDGRVIFIVDPLVLLQKTMHARSEIFDKLLAV